MWTLQSNTLLLLLQLFHCFLYQMSCLGSYFLNVTNFTFLTLISWSSERKTPQLFHTHTHTYTNVQNSEKNLTPDLLKGLATQQTHLQGRRLLSRHLKARDWLLFDLEIWIECSYNRLCGEWEQIIPLTVLFELALLDKDKEGDSTAEARSDLRSVWILVKFISFWIWFSCVFMASSTVFDDTEGFYEGVIRVWRHNNAALCY